MRKAVSIFSRILLGILLLLTLAPFYLSGAVQFLLGADSAARRLSGGDGDVPDAKLHGGYFQKPV